MRYRYDFTLFYYCHYFLYIYFILKHLCTYVRYTTIVRVTFYCHLFPSNCSLLSDFDSKIISEFWGNKISTLGRKSKNCHLYHFVLIIRKFLLNCQINQQFLWILKYLKFKFYKIKITLILNIFEIKRKTIKVEIKIENKFSFRIHHSYYILAFQNCSWDNYGIYLPVWAGTKNFKVTRFPFLSFLIFDLDVHKYEIQCLLPWQTILIVLILNSNLTFFRWRLPKHWVMSTPTNRLPTILTPEIL